MSKSEGGYGQEHDERRGSKGTQSSGKKSTGEEGNSNVYFIIPRKVTILYGPYMFQGMMDYRTERLKGIKAFLEKLGVTVELIPCLDHVNLCRVWFLDELIFSCKVTDLIHGGDGELDPVCWDAAEKLEKFIKKVLKGLRTQRPQLTAEELKRPFCPCFQVERGTQYVGRPQQKLGIGGGKAKGVEAASTDVGSGGKRSEVRGGGIVNRRERKSEDRQGIAGGGEIDGGNDDKHSANQTRRITN